MLLHKVLTLVNLYEILFPNFVLLPICVFSKPRKKEKWRGTTSMKSSVTMLNVSNLITIVFFGKYLSSAFLQVIHFSRFSEGWKNSDRFLCMSELDFLKKNYNFTFLI